MKSPLLTKSALLILCFALAACSSGAGSLFDNKSGVPSAANVPVGNNLALPPDLSLATPTATTDAYQPNGYVAPITQPHVPPPAGSSDIYSDEGVSLAQGDVYARYGISRFKPNGKLKTKAELKEELRLRVLLKHKEVNPNYGSAANIGNVLSGKDPILMTP